METKFREASLGKIKADLVLKNAQFINVFTAEIQRGDIAVCQDRIVGVGEYHGVEEIDLSGKFVAPGFIDAHLHIESSLCVPTTLASEVVSWGTTTLLADPHEVANVKGIQAIRYFLDAADQMPLNLYIMLPSCVPATPEEDNGCKLFAQDLKELIAHPKVLGMGEMMNVPGVCEGDQKVEDILSLFATKPKDGHAPSVSGKTLQCYCLHDISSDHESVAEGEVLEKLRAGMFIMARQGTAEQNLDMVLKTVRDHHLPTHQIGFCTDDKAISDIRRDGHISYHIKKAIAAGIPTIQAYQMASYNTARHYGLNHLGAIAPGKKADLVVLDSLEDVAISQVFAGGQLVAQRHKPILIPSMDYPKELKNTVFIKPVTKEDLILKADQNPYPVIGIVPNQIMTKKEMIRLPQKDGVFLSSQELMKIAVIERHHATGNVGVGVLYGMGIHGAIASTVGHDSHNLIVAGDNDEDMLQAIRELEQSGGGYILVQDGNVQAQLALPICGLLTDCPAEEIIKKMKELSKEAMQMGCPEEFEPFSTLSFLSLTVIPELRITDRGLCEFGG